MAKKTKVEEWYECDFCNTRYPKDELRNVDNLWAGMKLVFLVDYEWAEDGTDLCLGCKRKYIKEWVERYGLPDEGVKENVEVEDLEEQEE